MGNSVSYCDTEPAEEAPVEQVQENESVADEPAVEEAEEEVEEEEPKEKFELWTAPVDRRFPGTNQARNCYTRYNEYYKCKQEKDENSPECLFYYDCFKSLCPNDWVEKWEEQREEGTWPGKY